MRIQRSDPSRDGFSVLEALIVTGLLAIIGLVVANLVKPVSESFRRYRLRQELTSDSTSCIYVISRVLGNARRDSLVIDSPGASFPPSSRLRFRAPECPQAASPCTIEWVNSPATGNAVSFTVPGKDPRILARNVAGLTFDADARDFSRIKVTLDMEVAYDAMRPNEKKYRLLIDQLVRIGNQ